MAGQVIGFLGIEAVVAGEVRRAVVAVEVGTVSGRAVDGNIVDRHMASGTTIDHPDRTGRNGGKVVGGMSLDSQDFGKIGRVDTQNSQGVGGSTIWHDSQGCSRNDAG